jgi:hypothetical protein
MASRSQTIEGPSMAELNKWPGSMDTFAWPKTPIGWCAYYRELDRRFGGDGNDAPLGHNYRCPVHGANAK